MKRGRKEMTGQRGGGTGPGEPASGASPHRQGDEKKDLAEEVGRLRRLLVERERERRRVLDDVALLRRVLRALYAPAPLSDKADHLLDFALDRVGADWGILSLVDRRGQEEHRSARARGGRRIAAPASQVAETLIAAAIKEGRPWLVASVPESTLPRSGPLDGQLASALVVPLRVETTVLGALWVGAGPRARPLGAEEEEILGSLAADGAVALDSARLLERLNSENVRLREEARRKGGGGGQEITEK